uniref:LRAT domain-containing protein n=1 Tax=Strongyloides papillosus TaxID=174720 RepID=A0A0N5CCZ1_STREA
MNYAFTSEWTSAGELAKKLETGDLVEIRRTSSIGLPIYNHWAVYVGFANGIHKVVHLTNGNYNNGPNLFVNLFSSTSSTSTNNHEKNPSISIENFFDVCGNDQCRINNSMDKKYKPLSQSDIYDRALSKVGEHGYSVFNINCEHFAKWSRYNISTSDQANYGKAAFIGMGVLLFLPGGFLVVAAATGIKYLVSKFSDSVKKDPETISNEMSSS